MSKDIATSDVSSEVGARLGALEGLGTGSRDGAGKGFSTGNGEEAGTGFDIGA